MSTDGIKAEKDKICKCNSKHFQIRLIENALPEMRPFIVVKFALYDIKKQIDDAAQQIQKQKTVTQPLTKEQRQINAQAKEDVGDILAEMLPILELVGGIFDSGNDEINQIKTQELLSGE